MPNTVVSPKMNITVPVVLTDPGPDWATRIYNALFTTIDQHDHTPGKGVLLQTTSIGVNADFSFASFNATALRSARFTQQASALVLGSDVGCVYDVLGNLFWNNASGTAVQITNGSAVNNTLPALTGPVTGTGRTITAATYTIDSITADYYVFVDTTSNAITVTLPTPTAQRTMMLLDVKGNFGTNACTLAPHSVEKINGINVNKVLSAPWAMFLVVSNGTDWFVRGI